MIKFIPIIGAIVYGLIGFPKIEVPNLLEGYGTYWKQVNSGTVSRRYDFQTYSNSANTVSFELDSEEGEWIFTNWPDHKIGTKLVQICNMTKSDNTRSRCKWMTVYKAKQFLNRKTK